MYLNTTIAVIALAVILPPLNCNASSWEIINKKEVDRYGADNTTPYYKKIPEQEIFNAPDIYVTKNKSGYYYNYFNDNGGGGFYSHTLDNNQPSYYINNQYTEYLIYYPEKQVKQIKKPKITETYPLYFDE